MAPYILYIFSPLIVACFVALFTRSTINGSEQNKKCYLWICGIIMAFIIGARHYSNGSGDSGVYYDNWLFMSQVPLSMIWNTVQNIDLEPGYLYTVWGLSHIFKDPQFVFIFTGIFFTVTICVFVARNCSNVVLGLLIFNCFGEFNFLVQGLRQGVAMCICLWALEKCKKQQFWSFILLIGLAMLFHASAVVFFPMYFLARLQLKVKSVLLFIAGCTVGILSLSIIFDVINFLINDDYKLNEGIDDGSGVITLSIHTLIIVAGFLFYKMGMRDDPIKNKTYALFFYMTCLAAVTFAMRNMISGIAERVSYYFAFAEMIIVPNSFDYLKDEKIKIILTVIVILFFVLLALHKATFTTLIPYNFCWKL